ncbi:MAG TPA: IS66 family insertion sequence element accessory protein TnpB [Planctomycetota bacterium]|nr:IS66 family insertion sequence element accessory protein TnpB [Planctomycetota bacterium]
MLSLPPSVRIFVARAPVDMRRSIDGLAAAVIDVVDEDPQSGHFFVFFNRRRTHVKCLVWDRSGYWVHYKRLEHGRFRVFDRVSEKEGAFRLPAHELLLVLEGIDLRGSRRRLTHDDLCGKDVER